MPQKVCNVSLRLARPYLPNLLQGNNLYWSCGWQISVKICENKRWKSLSTQCPSFPEFSSSSSILRFRPVSSGLLSHCLTRCQRARERERDVGESGDCGFPAINAWNMTRNPNRCTAHWLGLPFRLPGFSVSSPLCSCARDEWYVSELFVRFLPVRVCECVGRRESELGNYWMTV